MTANPYAEIHAKAAKRTPSRQYPADTLISANEAPDGFYDNIEAAMFRLISDYEQEHGTLPPADWKPSVYWFGVSKVAHPFDADGWAECILEKCAENECLGENRFLGGLLAQRIIIEYDENAYEDWDDGWGDEENLEQALAPALAYVEKHGVLADRAELARLLAPAGEIVNGWFLGYEEDSDHAIDIEPEHIAAFVRNWTRREDEEPQP